MLLKDLGTNLSGEDQKALFTQFDKRGAKAELDLTEFVELLMYYFSNKENLDQAKNVGKAESSKVETPGGEEEDDVPEMPEDIVNLSPDQQRKVVLKRACTMMGLGTLMVLVFSDPMCDVLSEWGKRLDISPFYISFVLAPFASNASELLAAYSYAVKKSQSTITTSLSTLVGAACMNNTFCLGIFFALVYCKGLAWQFTAETIAIMLIQWLIGALAIVKTTHSTLIGICIFLCYPLCLFVVWALENIVGLD
jgi:Ca2+/Na+ antiporter